MSRLSTLLNYIQSAAGVTHWPAHAVAAIARNSPFNQGTLQGRIKRAFFKEITLHPKAIAPFSLLLPLTDQSGTIVYDELFLDNIYDLDRVENDPEVIFDFGAHMGFFTLLAARRFPKAAVVCFEPSPRNMRYLRRNITANNINAVMMPFAIDSKCGTAQFEGAGFGGRLATSHGGPTEEVLTVNIVRLLDAFRGMRTVIKMDVEGAEEWLIPAMIDELPSDCSIFLETHQTSDQTDMLLAPLRESGFQMEEIRVRSFDGVDYKEWFLCRRGGRDVPARQ